MHGAVSALTEQERKLHRELVRSHPFNQPPPMIRAKRERIETLRAGAWDD